ncbi:pilus assembly protein TadG-related protein [Microvirga sp. KLBC 81]|uniref:pilus assembly protein TadG-related protein n=1 Tax=Microvirga sp. KLBC 81 TaxID=1862707 RepID=UPI002110925D|nr:pilus assembly protein TadG-related protein [Microvirga sp. KLBC 81]
MRRLARDERAAVIVWFAFTLPVILGMFALSLDLGRYTSMHTELKDMADAAALAAANALDGTDTAIQKADAAAAAVVNNSKFADSWGDGARISLVYASSYDNLGAGNYLAKGVAADEKKAAWVQAITNVGTVNGLIIQVLGGDPTMTASVRSTAGTQTVACAVQPLFMCLPSGGTTLTPGTMVRVREQPGSQWGPGNFGLLDPPNAAPNQKNDLLQHGLAASSPNVCYVNALTPAQGGQAGKVREAINARFDIWDNNPDADVRIPPGPNNFKGIAPQNNSACVKSIPIDPYPRNGGVMPRDSCFPDGCNGPYGNGDWQAGAATYWSTHHTTAYPGFATRFAMYMAELGLDADGNALESGQPALKPSDPEYLTMGPVCAAQRGITGPTGTWERRVIYAAMIDCVVHADWLVGNSTKSPIKDADIGQFFLTEPTEQGQEVYMEFIKRITKDDDEGKLHAIVQLYPNPQDGN